jgi:hypothetical protein
MAVQSVNTIDRTGGTNPTTLGVQCASGGDSFPNTGAQFVFWNNTSGGSITITEVLQATVDGQATATVSRTFAIAAGATLCSGPYPTTSYNDGNGRMNFTYSVNPPTGLKITVLQLTTS